MPAMIYDKPDPVEKAVATLVALYAEADGTPNENLEKMFRRSVMLHGPEKALAAAGNVTRADVLKSYAKADRERADREARERNARPTYETYIQSFAWKRTAKEARERAGNRCQVCNSNSETLHVHHRTYERLGHEEPMDLTVLCESCHRLFHENGKLKRAA